MKVFWLSDNAKKKKIKFTEKWKVSSKFIPLTRSVDAFRILYLQEACIFCDGGTVQVPCDEKINSLNLSPHFKHKYIDL